MRAARRILGLAALAALVLSAPSRGQAIPERDEIVNALSQFDSAPDIDVMALRQKAQEKSRSRGRNEPPPTQRVPVAPELQSLPTFTLDIHFDTDTPVVRPDSYQTVGRLADAFVNAKLQPYSFLVVGHSDSTGRREANLILSQRRADAVRDVLVNTFKISAKRFQTLGLGEEQFIDPARPTSPANLQIQIVTMGKMADQEPPPAEPAAAPAPAKKAKKKH
jgi:outer membrane protein OmpA-like peptidoglycan-associated protein